MSRPTSAAPADTAPAGARTLREVFTIPEHTGTDDYVLKLSSSVQADQLGATIASYVVTAELAHAFDQALSVVEEAQRSGENKAAFLEGSFGSGKSHFMAVLHALLGQDPRARAIRELQPTLTRHTPLESQRLLRLTFHFLDSDSIESALFAQYLTQITALHPDTLPPVLHSAEGLFANAAALRETMHDDVAFFAKLNATAPAGNSTWALLGVAPAAWTPEGYAEATGPSATADQRQQAKAALVASHFTGFTRNSDWLPLEEGLEAIATHAKSLGYQGVVLLLDELVLWLTFIITERERLNREVQKITKLVEGSRGRLAVPITSIIARQHDLRRWLGTSTDVGADQDAFERALSHQSGRFTTIVLGDENLPAIAHERLLRPKDETAKEALRVAFGRVDRSPQVWEVLRDGINSSDEHRGADTRAFQLTYPFSPALIDTLKNVAGLMQRERTALKVMQKMLVDNADRLTIDNVIPVGEAFDDIVSGTTTSSDPAVTLRFKLARELWVNKLRPFILTQYNVPVETADADLQTGPRGEVRLAKTLILAAIAPSVPALMQITPARLAALNHGSIREILPGDAAARALRSVQQWQASVPEIRISEDRNPVITVTLAEVDYQSVIDRARGEDTEGRRRDLVRDMLYAELEVDSVDTALGGARTRRVIWRGTRRDVDIVYGNVRDAGFLPDEQFRARPGTVRIVLDYPFDVAGFGTREDHLRIDRFTSAAWNQPTIVWLPTFLRDEENTLLGKLVILNTVLRGENWAAHSSDLSEVDRPQARAILEAQQRGIRGQLGSILQQVYGAAAGRTFPEGEEPLRSLSASFDPRRPIGGSLGAATNRLIDQAFTALYPNHPDFSPADREIPEREINHTLTFLRAADAHADGRIALDRSDRDLVRRIVMPLQLAKVNETHLIFTATEFTTWDNRISQVLASRGVDPSREIQVETLRYAVDPDDARRRLTPAIRDLIVASWASRHRRAWYLHNSAIDEPATVRDIHPAQVLRTEPLPDTADWSAALVRYGRLFGAMSNDHLAASNLATFVRDALVRIGTTQPDQQRLVQQLTALYGTFGLDSLSPRLALATALQELFARLIRQENDRVAFVELLARTPLPGTDSEAGRSVASAASVSQAVAATTWQRFGILREAAAAGGSRGDQAQAILEGLTAAAVDQEHNKQLVRAISEADNARQRWLEEGVQRTPERTPEPTGLRNPQHRGTAAATENTVTIDGPGDWTTLRSRIVDVLASYPEQAFDVSVEVREISAARGGDHR